MELTAYSVRSFLTPASGSSSYLVLARMLRAANGGRGLRPRAPFGSMTAPCSAACGSLWLERQPRYAKGSPSAETELMHPLDRLGQP